MNRFGCTIVIAILCLLSILTPIMAGIKDQSLLVRRHLRDEVFIEDTKWHSLSLGEKSHILYNLIVDTLDEIPSYTAICKAICEFDQISITRQSLERAQIAFEEGQPERRSGRHSQLNDDEISFVKGYLNAMAAKNMGLNGVEVKNFIFNQFGKNIDIGTIYGMIYGGILFRHNVPKVATKRNKCATVDQMNNFANIARATLEGVDPRFIVNLDETHINVDSGKRMTIITGSEMKGYKHLKRQSSQKEDVSMHISATVAITAGVEGEQHGEQAGGKYLSTQIILPLKTVPDNLSREQLNEHCFMSCTPSKWVAN
eukprot:TRINITY_DN7221_c0_g3_i1.p1 TRINITY_DN7221_c0_g3~~TRINITY_DN7221_c0_g3_i1.p1  ORF type:complete len:314 (+),score=54.83 TRINITY_DN7221_c0_g3_i1:46-987(+)